MIRGVLKAVFGRTAYVICFVLVTVLIFTVTLWLPNIEIILSYLVSEAAVSDKLYFVGSLYQSLDTTHSGYSAATAFAIAVLSGVNVTLLAFYTRRVSIKTPGFVRTHAHAYAGIIMGFLGVGCIACGSVILSALLALVGVGGLLVLLPFHGAEVGVLALLLLVCSNYYLIKKINDPVVCSV